MLKKRVPELNQAIENSNDDAVIMCHVRVSLKDAVKLQKRINDIVEANTDIEVPEDMIPIQLIMISNEWLEVQHTINRL